MIIFPFLPGKINGRIVHCGGHRNPNLLYSDECFEYLKAADVWSPVQGLDVPRDGVSLVQLNDNDFWIAGTQPSLMLSLSKHVAFTP